MRGSVLLVLTLAVLPAARAQGPPPERMETLSRLRTKPPSAWTDADATQAVQAVFGTIVEIAGDHMPPDQRSRLGEFTVEIGRWEGRAPASMVDRTLLLQESYFDEMLVLAGLLAHDLHVIYLDWLPDPQPLLTRPWAETPLLPLLRPLSVYAENSAWFASCPQGLEGCRLLLGTTIGATLGFVASHELAHRLYGHEGNAAARYPLDQEKSADRLARRILDRMHAEASFEDEGFAEAFELALAAGPLLTLENEIEKTPWRAADLRVRLDSLAQELPERLRDDALDLVRPETSSENAGRLRVVWDETPELLIVNGMTVSPEEVQGRELRVAGALHRVFARSRDRFAFDRVVAEGAAPAVARLLFQPLAAPVSAAELEGLEEDRAWLELLCRTSRADLTPGEAWLAPRHLRALRRMGLDAWIDADGWGMLSGEDLRRARLARQRSRALAGWR